MRFAKLLIPAVPLAVSLAGCDGSEPRGFGNRDVSWSRGEPGKEMLPGLDSADIDLGTWGDMAALVVWTDGRTSLGAAGMGNRELQPGESRKGARYEGEVQAVDGRSWKVECYTPDGKTGLVKIGDRSFDLAEGALFLVSTRGEIPRVKQLPLSKLDLKPDGARTHYQVDGKSLEELARTDAELRSFFTEAAGGK